MKLATAKTIAKEIYDGVLSGDDFMEAEENECVREVVKLELDRLIERLGDISDTYFKDPLRVKPKFIRTWGTPKLDMDLSPIEDHTYCLIAGGAGSGKTTWMTDVAIKNCLEGGRVLLFSLEMTDEQIISRYALFKSGITKSEFRTREIPDEKMEQYRKAYSYLSNMEGLVLRGTGDNDNDIKALLDIVAKEKPDLCIIDNLGLIRGQGKEIELQANISREIVGFTNTYKIPILLIHHLAKQDSQKKDNIRGSQKLQDDADMTLITGRLTDSDEERERRKFFIKVKKDRIFGDTDVVHCLHFIDGQFRDDPQPGF